MSWYKNKYLKKLFLETTEWNVAWKLKSDDRYKIIKNPEGYWLADSLIFYENSNTYLFCEAFEKQSGLGRLGVLTFDGNNFSDFKIILKEKYHLSYPYVFKHKNKYFMIPESSENNTVDLYEAEEFPYRWKKIKCLANGRYVDTTVIHKYNAAFTLYSYDMSTYQLIEGVLDMDKLELSELTKKEDKAYKRRSGGNIYQENGMLCRAVQNNKYFYGQSLIVLNCESNEEIKEIIPESIKTIDNKKFRRIHTCSTSGTFEAIDVSNYRFNLFKFLKRLRLK